MFIGVYKASIDGALLTCYKFTSFKATNDARKVQVFGENIHTMVYFSDTMNRGEDNVVYF